MKKYLLKPKRYDRNSIKEVSFTCRLKPFHPLGFNLSDRFFLSVRRTQNIRMSCTKHFRCMRRSNN